MRDLLGLSAGFIDGTSGEDERLINRPTSELSEVADGIAVIEAFSHVVAFRADAGLVLFDTSSQQFAEANQAALRGWSDAPVRTVVFTHGHVDHVGGAGAVLDEALARGDARPQLVAHANVSPRFDRYERTSGYNAIINARQFGPTRRLSSGFSTSEAGARRFGPRPWHHPDVTFDDRMTLRAGDLTFELRHAIGETDDHLWAWVPERKAICSGDFVTWVFPNAGNPQKVQRYPLEWARALRDMAALGPELLLPAHGLPVAGKERIARMLDDIATALESLVEQCLALMNEGARLDRLIREVTVPQDALEKPYLRPVYDEPEFIVRNVWRLYGGWYDGNPANLKPAPDASVAAEVVALAGGVDPLLGRASELSGAGGHRLACHLAEMAALAEPDNARAHQVRAAVYEARAAAESSLMARGIYRWAAAESSERAGA